MATNKTRIKIRHGSTTPETGTNGLLPYELGWDGSHVALYINNNGTIKQINSESSVGIPLVSGDNIDTLAPGIYYSGSGAVSGTLSGTKPNGNSSGFRLEVIRGHSYNYGAQIAYDSTSSIKIRKNPVYHDPALNYSDFTDIPWQTIITSTNVDSYALPLNGGTLTGNLTIQHTGETYVSAKNTSLGTGVYLDCGASANHGIWSIGYYDTSDSAYVSSGKWLVYRNSRGDVILNGHGTDDLALTGGTVTGRINIQGGTAASPARVNLNNYDGSVTGFIGYNNGSTSYGLYINGTSPVSGYLAYINTSTGRVYYRDSYNDTAVSLAYSQSGLAYADYSWLAGWNGYELRAVAKTQFAQASHTHNYLPLAGGTMDDEKSITFQTTRKKEDGSGWAYTPVKVIDNTSTLFFNIGVRGSANTLYYAFIGANEWSSTANVRIYSDGTIQAGGCAVIRDSGATNRRVFVVTSASVPSGAVTGDIVLVKAS